MLTQRQGKEVAQLKDLRVLGWDVASFSPSTLAALQGRIASTYDATHGATMSTCQRVEVIGLRLDLESPAERRYEGEDALLHIASLAAGLDSLVLGETQIFGQVRGALSRGSAELRRLTAPALAAARALRREQSFSTHAGHTLDYALCHSGMPAGGRLLVLGGGAMGRQVAKRGVELGFQVTIATRTPMNAGPGIEWTSLSGIASLPSFDVVAGCLGAEAPRFEISLLPPVTTLIADFGTPCNFIGSYEAPVVTIAALLEYQRQTPALSEERERFRTRLRQILDERLVLSKASGDSPLGVMRGHVEEIRRREVARAARLHPELPVSALDTITRSLVNQIFHRPSLRLRHSSNQELAHEFAALFQAPPVKELAGDNE